MAGPYKMKNPMLKKAAKGGSMLMNYAGSPLPDHEKNEDGSVKYHGSHTGYSNAQVVEDYAATIKTKFKKSKLGKLAEELKRNQKKKGIFSGNKNK